MVEETEKLEEAVQYFKQREGYTRLLKELRKKYIALGQIKGNIVITKLSVIEKQELSGLMKKDYSKQVSITISLKKLEQVLENSRFEGITLPQLLNGYFQEQVITKQETTKRQEKEWEEFCREIVEENENTYMYRYLQRCMQNQDELYQAIKKYYQKEKIQFKMEFLNACKGINHLPQKITRIPVFASDILSNPHGFDKKTLCGRWFILLLCYIKKCKYPMNSEELAELYYQSNLLVDDVSNMVLCKNIHALLKTETGYEEHQGIKGFAKYREPLFLTLNNLANISCVKKSKLAFVTENPAVFMQLAEKYVAEDIAFVCTYGQVKLAGIILLDLMIEAGQTIYYSGDLDPEGIQIADKLKKRYQEKLKLVGFDRQTYDRNKSDVFLSDIRLQKLEKIESDELKEVCSIIKEKKKAAYEEKNINEIGKFMEKELKLGQF